MKHIYGPVKSRRLGLSLGISLTPYKTCDFDCVYCQLGETTRKTAQQKEHYPKEDILREFESWARNNPQEALKIDYVTLSGSGEPLLHKDFGEIIGRIRLLINKPVAVITNSSLLPDSAVRKSLLNCDLIVASLDAATQETFEDIDRPLEGIKIDDIIDGLIQLRKEFKGKLWLEIMLVKGINDHKEELEGLKSAIERIRPDKVQLNSPVRAPSFSKTRSLGKSKLEKICNFLGGTCEII